MPFVTEHRLWADAAALDATAAPDGHPASPLRAATDRAGGAEPAGAAVSGADTPAAPPEAWSAGIAAALRTAAPITELEVCALLPASSGGPAVLHAWNGTGLLPAGAETPPAALLPQSGGGTAVLFGGPATASASSFRLLCTAAGAAAEELARRMRSTAPEVTVDERTGPWPLATAGTPVVHLVAVTAGEP
ncbi:hypothetical protein AB0I72_01640 [Nocardiopsis sp. NPDC049922]|uniref:hypothetical protein n=1 Tax=Nocardiopsis sp. NPDC049922 TaxID=3155157 RepID=UPI0033C9F1BA